MAIEGKFIKPVMLKSVEITELDPCKHRLVAIIQELNRILIHVTFAQKGIRLIILQMELKKEEKGISVDTPSLKRQFFYLSVFALCLFLIM